MSDEISVDRDLCAASPAAPGTSQDDLLYWLWLAHVLQPANRYAGAVLDAYGSAQEVYRRRGDEAFFASLTTPGTLARLRSAPPPESFQRIQKDCLSLGVHILPCGASDYPQALLDLFDPPIVLYCTGDPKHLNAPSMAGMVGSRRPSPYGVEAAAKLGRELASAGVVIVSGLADGLDSEAHRAALACNTPTVGILGVPISKTYPANNVDLRYQIEQNGAVLSEYPPGAGSMPQKAFLDRNRLIAGMSSALLVLEARLESGSMSTVSHAQAYGRPVFAVPGNIFSPLCEGTNMLLEEGKARVAVTARPVLETLHLVPPQDSTPKKAGKKRRRKKADGPVLSNENRLVLSCMGSTPQGLAAIAAECQLPTGKLLAILTSLELEGYIQSLPGQLYAVR